MYPIVVLQMFKLPELRREAGLGGQLGRIDNSSFPYQPQYLTAQGARQRACSYRQQLTCSLTQVCFRLSLKISESSTLALRPFRACLTLLSPPHLFVHKCFLA